MPDSSLPKRSHVTLVEALTWRALGKALTFSDIWRMRAAWKARFGTEIEFAPRYLETREQRTREAKDLLKEGREEKARWDSMLERINGAEWEIFNAHTRGALTLTGRPINGAAWKPREKVPQDYFADAVATDLLRNTLGPDYGGLDSAHYRRTRQYPNEWGDVMVATHELRAFWGAGASKKRSKQEAVTAFIAEAYPNGIKGKSDKQIAKDYNTECGGTVSERTVRRARGGK